MSTTTAMTRRVNASLPPTASTASMDTDATSAKVGVGSCASVRSTSMARSATDVPASSKASQSSGNSASSLTSPTTTSSALTPPLLPPSSDSSTSLPVPDPESSSEASPPPTPTRRNTWNSLGSETVTGARSGPPTPPPASRVPRPSLAITAPPTPPASKSAAPPWSAAESSESSPELSVSVSVSVSDADGELLPSSAMEVNSVPATAR